MTLILAGSIADNAGLDEADVVRRYMAWFQNFVPHWLFQYRPNLERRVQ